MDATASGALSEYSRASPRSRWILAVKAVVDLGYGAGRRPAFTMVDALVRHGPE